MRSEETEKLKGKELADRLDALHKKLLEDSDFEALCTECLDLSVRLSRTMDTMPEAQRDAVADYLGCMFEMHRRTLIAALNLWEHPVD